VPERNNVCVKKESTREGGETFSSLMVIDGLVGRCAEGMRWERIADRRHIDFHIWEGGWQGCQFPTGVTFSWRIDSDGWSIPNYSQVG